MDTVGEHATSCKLFTLLDLLEAHTSCHRKCGPHDPLCLLWNSRAPCDLLPVGALGRACVWTILKYSTANGRSTTLKSRSDRKVGTAVVSICVIEPQVQVVVSIFACTFACTHWWDHRLEILWRPVKGARVSICLVQNCTLGLWSTAGMYLQAQMRFNREGAAGNCKL